MWATLFVGFGLVFLPAQLLGPTGLIPLETFGLMQAGGVVLVLAGAAIVLSAFLTFVFAGRGTAAPFEPPQRFVTTAPFRFVCNPIDIVAVISLIGAALYRRASGLLLYAGALGILFHGFRADL